MLQLPSRGQSLPISGSPDTPGSPNRPFAVGKSERWGPKLGGVLRHKKSMISPAPCCYSTHVPCRKKPYYINSIAAVKSMLPGQTAPRNQAALAQLAHDERSDSVRKQQW